MSIVAGLDWSLTKWKQPTVFSLELMKLAHYHKTHQKDIFKMAYEFNSEAFDKVYISKDYEDFLYPDYIMTDPKSEYVGLAISGGLYHPFPPEIESRPADTSIYDGMFKYYKKARDGKKLFNNMINACHLRVSLDGTTIDDNWSSQLIPATGRVRHVILHDRDVGKIKDSYTFVQSLANYYGKRQTRLGFKFPVIITDDKSALAWGSLTKSPGLSNLHFYNLISDAALESISIFKQQFTYVINNEYWTKERFLKEIPHILLQGMYLSKWAIPLLLKIEDDFKIDDEWRQVVSIFNDYMKSCCQYRNELVFSWFTYCKYCYLGLQREEKVDLFTYLKEEAPEFFNLIYNVEYVTFEQGEFVPHMYTWGEINKGGGYGGYHYKQKKSQLEMYNYATLISPEYLYLD